MTKRCIHDLFDERALQLLGDENYWRIVQCVIDDLVDARLVFDDLHVQSFVIYSLLAMSTLGGFCWPGAEKSVFAQTYGDVAHVIENGAISPAYLTVSRKGIKYPIFIHPIVEYALVVFVYQRMRVQTVRNNAPGPIRLSDYLAPMNPRSRKKHPDNHYAYRASLCNAYLENISIRQDIRIPPTVSDYLATGRSLLAFQYDLDVVYALLGAMDCSIPPIEQLLESLG
ncbi:hypothetical protein D6779_09065 [Candidatus Parcubacteria bacterium]|nr:MAG: hypothetical protein D6779_09065 [Candidatus Parcubacteria bacterium]